MKYKTICFDIDNVICKTNSKNEYSKSKPIKENIKIINMSYDRGFQIILYTARFMGRCNGNIEKVKKKNKTFNPKTVKKLGCEVS